MSELRNTGPRAPRSHVARVVTAIGTAVLLGGTVTLAACADAPSGPSSLRPAAPRLELFSPAVRLNGLTRNVPLAAPVTVSATIGRDGGEIKIKEAGFYLAVPAGAVAEQTRFTVTALPGNLVAYEFQPHGLVFTAQPKFEQSLKETDWDKLAKDAKLRGGYFKDNSQLDALTGTALVDETIPVEIDPKTGKLKMYLPHFSGYMVSWGLE